MVQRYKYKNYTIKQTKINDKRYIVTIYEGIDEIMISYSKRLLDEEECIAFIKSIISSIYYQKLKEVKDGK